MLQPESIFVREKGEQTISSGGVERGKRKKVPDVFLSRGAFSDNFGRPQGESRKTIGLQVGGGRGGKRENGGEGGWCRCEKKKGDGR